MSVFLRTRGYTGRQEHLLPNSRYARHGSVRVTEHSKVIHLDHQRANQVPSNSPRVRFEDMSSDLLEPRFRPTCGLPTTCWESFSDNRS
jgi:hypothetical protein